MVLEPTTLNHLVVHTDRGFQFDARLLTAYEISKRFLLSILLHISNGYNSRILSEQPWKPLKDEWVFPSIWTKCP
jgi:hypothetical protein